MIEVRGKSAAIRRAYNIFSFFYPILVAPFEGPAIEEGLRRADVKSGERILDAACGTGNVLAKLRERVGPSGIAVGIDFAPRMLSAAMRRAREAWLVGGDIRQLPFASETFDLVWSSYTLDLIPTPEIAVVLRDFFRVLHRDGRIALVSFTKTREELTWWERGYLQTPPRLVPYIWGSCRPIHLASYVQEAGFTGLECEIVQRGMRSEVLTARRP